MTQTLKEKNRQVLKDNEQRYALLDGLIALAEKGWRGSRADMWVALEWSGRRYAITRLRGELHARGIEFRQTGRRCGVTPSRLAGEVEWELVRIS